MGSELEEGAPKIETTELSVGLAVGERERGDLECWLLCAGLVPGQGDDSAWGPVNKEEKAGQTNHCD